MVRCNASTRSPELLIGTRQQYYPLKMMNMKNTIIAAAVLAGIFSATVANAGNEDRVGSAGSTELLINPWARSASWGSAGVSSVTGIEATYMNVAGLALTKQTEASFASSSWLKGSGIRMNQAGLAQRVGETSVIGLTFNSMTFGDIPITTTELPEGGIGTFSPRYFNIGFSYAKEFSNSIYGGLTVKALSQSIANVKGTGVCFDAGIRYVTGEKDQIKFGITLKNVGPPMKYSGDGFSSLTTLSTGTQMTTEQRSARFEIPSQVNIGASYDFLFGETQKLIVAGAFTSNSFSKDNWRIGAEYNYTMKKASFSARAGYAYENGIFSSELGVRSTAFTGPTAGFSVDLITGEKGNHIGLDYGYRVSNPFSGVHTIGIRIEVN